jgi:DNA-binding transcriptional regulator GbsR (MarR family)
MKLTQKEAKLFKESHNRWLNESSFLARLFLKQVTSGIKDDKDLQKSIEDADKDLEKTRNKIEKIASGDKEKVKTAIPPNVRKYLGFDY